MQIFGYDPELKELTNGVKERLGSIEGVANLFSSSDQGRPELRLIMDRERISRVGMNTNRVASAVSDAVKGNIATSFVDQGVEFEVLVELDPKDKSETRLSNIQIQTPASGWMPLKNLARLERYTGPTNVMRINQERVTEITAELRYRLESNLRSSKNTIRSGGWPMGIDMNSQYSRRASRVIRVPFNCLCDCWHSNMVMASQFESLLGRSS